MEDPDQVQQLEENHEAPPLIHPTPAILSFVRVEDSLLLYRDPQTPPDRDYCHRYIIDAYALADEHPAVGAAWTEALATGGCLCCLSEGDVAARVTIYVKPVVEALRQHNAKVLARHADACPGCDQPDDLQGVLWEPTSFEFETRSTELRGRP